MCRLAFGLTFLTFRSIFHDFSTNRLEKPTFPTFSGEASENLTILLSANKRHRGSHDNGYRGQSIDHVVMFWPPVELNRTGVLWHVLSRDSATGNLFIFCKQEFLATGNLFMFCKQELLTTGVLFMFSKPESTPFDGKLISTGVFWKHDHVALEMGHQGTFE